MTNPPVFCCAPWNNLYRAYRAGGNRATRLDDVVAAVEAAAPGSAVLILADSYPELRTEVPPETVASAAAKNLRLYVEYPRAVPGLELGPPQRAQWERLVVADTAFGPALPEGALLTAHACVFLPARSRHTLLALARVAGYDRAIFGIPESAQAVLSAVPELGALIATTKLSGFRTGRYAPTAAWTALWTGILQLLMPDRPAPTLSWTPVVRPTVDRRGTLDPAAEANAVSRARQWHLDSGMLLTPAAEDEVRVLMPGGSETAPRRVLPLGPGDGSHGALEGFTSSIDADGTQQCRLALRADCSAETAMVLAVSQPDLQPDSQPDGAPVDIAGNLLDYIFTNSGMCGGDRGRPDHPAYGLIAWGIGLPAWEVANYGDDNARALLACLLVGARNGSGRWTEPILRAVLANLRTTGRRGFRGDRIDMPELTRNGWRHYFDGDVVNVAPHFEAYLWACYLWAFQVTGYEPFRERATAGISATMAAFPDGWRRNDVTERSRMLLPLAWLVRVADTPEHRDWLTAVAEDLMRDQQDSGALPERELGGVGLFRVPHTNEEYGVTESPLIQTTGDPATDQLYTTGFALIGLHEAAMATGDPRLRGYADQLADYLVRIQTRSDDPTLDGTWLRAFDYERWDYWSSSGDLGWGAWCVELGWGQAWIVAGLALRQADSTLWDEAARVVPTTEQAARLVGAMIPAATVSTPQN
ncbi:MAG TPA: hypothetical protein VHX59_22400 [Mycobacteriales bacterium]|nr:hypothetical protein [Mycobacteriales bacterium]